MSVLPEVGRRQPCLLVGDQRLPLATNSEPNLPVEEIIPRTWRLRIFLSLRFIAQQANAGRRSAAQTCRHASPWSWLTLKSWLAGVLAHAGPPRTGGLRFRQSAASRGGRH